MVLLGTVALIVLMDQLASAVFGFVYGNEDGWWGQTSRQSPWTQAVQGGLALKSRDLTISIAGDTLTAVYTVTAPAGSALARRAVADDDAGAGNDLVASALGAVQVAEFRYGFTGSQYTPVTLAFERPRLSIADGSATVTVSSDPFRLYRHRQEILVSRPSGVTVGQSNDQIHLKALSAEVWRPSGAIVAGIANGTANLIPAASDANVDFTMSEGSLVPGWLDGLRGIGGMTIPVADAFLNRIAALLPLIVLLWSLETAERGFPGIRVVGMARKAVAAVVVGLAAVAVLGFAFDISQALHRPDWISAGPLGLLAGGAAIAWPAACWRAGSGNLPKRDGRGPEQATRRPRPVLSAVAAWLRALSLPVLIHLAVVAGYGWLLYGYLAPRAFFIHIGAPPGEVLALALATAALAASLMHFLLGMRSWRAWLVSAAFSAAVLAATVAWPLLWYNYHAGTYVNALGKWAFLGIAVVVVAGLCVMSGRIALAVLENFRLCAADRHRLRAPRSQDEADAAPHRFPWKTVVVSVVVMGISVTVLPDAASESGVLDPHAIGLVPFDLFELFDALPQLLSWLGLLLAIVVAMAVVDPPPDCTAAPASQPAVPTQADPRLVARDLALPIALLLLYWNDQWFYIPVTIIAGMFLIRCLLMPRSLAAATPRANDVKAALRNALAGWRKADFASGQRQALAASSTDVLRDSLLDEKAGSYDDRLEKLTRAQENLGDKQDAYQRTAHDAKRDAFGYRGTMPDRGAARDGLITGTVLGIIPVTITMLTAQPSSAGSIGYPVLGFLGFTAWTLFSWAGLGWFIGYYLPIIRGGNGTEKATWIFITAATASLPASLIWDDGHDWAATLVSDLELLVFLVVATVILADLRALKSAGFRPTDWPRVHNWRFVVTWSTALLTAIGTIAITFATTTVTDISQQLNPPPGTSSTTHRPGP